MILFYHLHTQRGKVDPNYYRPVVVAIPILCAQIFTLTC